VGGGIAARQSVAVGKTRAESTYGLGGGEGERKVVEKGVGVWVEETTGREEERDSRWGGGGGNSVTVSGMGKSVF